MTTPKDTERRRRWSQARNAALAELRSNHQEEYADLLASHRDRLGVGGAIYAPSLPDRLGNRS